MRTSSRKTSRPAAGFSLIEVMLAVVVLTMGLIFVATQFPLALHLARDVTQRTRGVVETHNADAAAAVQIQRLAWGDMYYGMGFLGSSGFIDPGSNRVRFLPQPNVRINISADWQDQYVLDNVQGVAPALNVTYNLNSAPYHQLDTDDKLRGVNLGLVTSPPIDTSDADVLAYLRNTWGYTVEDIADGDPTDEEWDEAVRVVALERRYCWSALYYPLGSGALQFYIFTFSPTENSLYALQDPTVTDGVENPTPYDSDEDRLFPVPWRIQLKDAIDPLDDTQFDPDNLSDNPIDRFVLDDYTDYPGAILDVLRVDMNLVDARHGTVYRVTEINALSGNRTEIRLDRELDRQDLLQEFWIFPPPIVREGNGYYFAEDSDVVTMSVKTVQF